MPEDPAAADHRDQVVIVRLPWSIPVAAASAAVLVAAAVGCGGSSRDASPSVSYHEPSQGWTARVPAGWTSVVTGPALVRGDPLRDPHATGAAQVPAPNAGRGAA